jgi:hypothetical protein
MIGASSATRGQALPQREQDIVRACLDLLQLRGVFSWRQNCGAVKQAGRRGHRDRFIRFASINGVSDILAVLPPNGRLLAIECKRPGNGPTEDQAAFLDAVTRRGGLAVVIYDVRDLAEILDRELRKAAA